jgi:hypothetical protein
MRCKAARRADGDWNKFMLQRWIAPTPLVRLLKNPKGFDLIAQGRVLAHPGKECEHATPTPKGPLRGKMTCTPIFPGLEYQPWAMRLTPLRGKMTCAPCAPIFPGSEYQPWAMRLTPFEGWNPPLFGFANL